MIHVFDDNKTVNVQAVKLPYSWEKLHSGAHVIHCLYKDIYIASLSTNLKYLCTSVVVPGEVKMLSVFIQQKIICFINSGM